MCSLVADKRRRNTKQHFRPVSSSDITRFDSVRPDRLVLAPAVTRPSLYRSLVLVFVLTNAHRSNIQCCALYSREEGTALYEPPPTVMLLNATLCYWCHAVSYRKPRLSCRPFPYLTSPPPHHAFCPPPPPPPPPAPLSLLPSPHSPRPPTSSPASRVLNAWR